MRLLDLYRYMHSRIHSTSRPLKLIYHVAERETLLAWVRAPVYGNSYCSSHVAPFAARGKHSNLRTPQTRRSKPRAHFDLPERYTNTSRPSLTPSLQVTSKFELYSCFSPLVTKACAITAITKLLRWIKKEEDRLFIRYPPKYSTTPNPSKSSRGGKSDQQDSTDNGFLSLL